MLVSVIVPVYNVEEYIERCLSSIERQVFNDLQIILIDDGSTDHSGFICDKYAEVDDRINVIHTDNRGVSAARNSGIEFATGEYVIFVDADDIVHPQMIEKMVECAKKGHYDMLICNNYKFYSTDNFPPIRYVDEVTSIPSCSFDFYGKYTHSTVWGVLYKTSIVKSLRFCTDIYIAEDSLFFTEALVKVDRVGHLPTEYYGYFIRENSASRRKKYDKKKFTEIIAWQRICKQINDRMPGSVLCNSSNAALGMNAYKALKIMAYEADLNNPYWEECYHIMKQQWRYIIKSSMDVKTKMMYTFSSLFPQVGINIYLQIKHKNTPFEY